MFRIIVKGADSVEAFLLKLDKALDTQKILDEGAAVLFNRMRTRFLAEQSPTGEQWIPSQAALRRAARGIGGGTLFKTGRLFHSLQVSAEGDNARSIGTNATASGGYDYPRVHNFGLSGFPERRFIGFAEDDNVVMGQVIIRRLRDGLK